MKRLLMTLKIYPDDRQKFPINCRGEIKYSILAGIKCWINICVIIRYGENMRL